MRLAIALALSAVAGPVLASTGIQTLDHTPMLSSAEFTERFSLESTRMAGKGCDGRRIVKQTAGITEGTERFNRHHDRFLRHHIGRIQRRVQEAC